MDSLPSDMTRLILTFVEQDTLFDLVLVSKKLRQIVFSAPVDIKANDSTIGGKTLARFKNARIDLSNPMLNHSWNFTILNSSALVLLDSYSLLNVVDLLRFHNLKTIICNGFKSTEFLHKLTSPKNVIVHICDEIETKHFPEFGSKLESFHIKIPNTSNSSNTSIMTEELLADCCTVTKFKLEGNMSIQCDNFKLFTRLRSLTIYEDNCEDYDDENITRSALNFRNLAALSETLTKLSVEVYYLNCQELIALTNLCTLKIKNTKVEYFKVLGTSLTSLKLDCSSVSYDEIEQMTSLRKLYVADWFSKDIDRPYTTNLVNLVDHHVVHYI